METIVKRVALLTSTALLLAGVALTGAPRARAQDQGAAHEQHHSADADQVPPQPVPPDYPTLAFERACRASN